MGQVKAWILDEVINLTEEDFGYEVKIVADKMKSELKNIFLLDNKVNSTYKVLYICKGCFFNQWIDKISYYFQLKTIHVTCSPWSVDETKWLI